MKIKDLIKELEKLDGEKEIYIVSDDMVGGLELTSVLSLILPKNARWLEKEDREKDGYVLT